MKPKEAEELLFTSTIEEQLESWNWVELEQTLDEQGYPKTPVLLSAAQCGELIEFYAQEALFRSRIEMAQYNFGRGEYQYFAYPLPLLLEQLRSALYSRLAPFANRWVDQLGLSASAKAAHDDRPFYPANLIDFLAHCYALGQRRPTPLILRYEAGGYNCLHQDLYGEVAFPLQVVFGLSQHDYEGGELLLVEQRPRAQSIGQTITLEQGQGLIFPKRYRPVKSSRGYYRVNVRHGVSLLHWGLRYSLGLIFHDAR